MRKKQLPSQNLFLTSFLGSQQDTPYLSPLPTNFRKQSDEFEILSHFSLEAEHEVSQVPLQPEAMGEDEAVAVLQEAAYSHHQFCEEPPSPHFLQLKEDPPPPSLLLSQEHRGESKVRVMIQFLVGHSGLQEKQLDAQGRKFSKDDAILLQIFQLLVRKFRSLHKTKEQLTKYCMRKAFKFIADRSKKERDGHSRDLDNWMREYFSESSPTNNFSIPFKKHSAEKTMNSNFLRRVFSCQQFALDYRIFLDQFARLTAEDNLRKVAYLTDMVQEALDHAEPARVQKIKRLPWTAEILKQVNELAFSIADASQQGGLMGRRNRRQHE